MRKESSMFVECTLYRTKHESGKTARVGKKKGTSQEKEKARVRKKKRHESGK